MNMKTTCGGLMVVGMLLGAAGCVNEPTLVPNRDPVLRKTISQFAADAAVRHPYKADAPRGGNADARCQVGYFFKDIDMVNLTDQDWKDVEVWVNQQYVCFVPVMESKILKTVPFQILFDAKGGHFPTNKVLVEKIEIFRDGKMYDVPKQVAD